jgi:hypothetical protein
VNYYTILTKETGVIVGASNDKTGNIKYGGDWVMENTSQNIELTYFTKSIEYYRYLLDSTTDSLLVIKNNGYIYIYGTGSNTHGQLGLKVDSVGFVTQLKKIPYGVDERTPKYISCGSSHTVVLMTDDNNNTNTIWGTGYNGGGQLGLGNENKKVKGVDTLTQMKTVDIDGIDGSIPKYISCGSIHTVVLMTDDTVWGTGLNNYCQLGSVNTSKITELIKITDETNYISGMFNAPAPTPPPAPVPAPAPSPSPSQATASGDPYISTLCGKKFKLPNSTKIYRMAETTYNNKQLIVNASVSQLTEQEIIILKKFASKITNRRPVTNGYFFDKFFISYGNKYAIFNRNIELLETNIEQNNTDISIDFNNELKDFSCPLQLQGKCKQKEINIKIADKITINLLNIFNPQIINGVEFNYNGNNENIKGIFNTFYHPKNYVIKQIDNTKPIKLKTNLPEYKKQISDKFDLLI